MGAWPLHHGQKPPHYLNGAFCIKNNRTCLKIHQVTERLRLISVDISRDKKANHPARSLEDMLLHAKAYIILRPIIEF